MTDQTSAEVDDLIKRLREQCYSLVEGYGESDGVRIIEALRQRAEAAEAEVRVYMNSAEAHMVEHFRTSDRLEVARAQAAAVWEAGHKVGAGKGGCGHLCGYDCNGACFLTPADLSAALQARLDAEWNAAIEAAAEAVGRLQRQDVTDSEGFVPPDRFDEGTDAAYERIRALRRSGKGE